MVQNCAHKVVVVQHTAHVWELQKDRPGSRGKWPEAAAGCCSWVDTWHQVQVGSSKPDRRTGTVGG